MSDPLGTREELTCFNQDLNAALRARVPLQLGISNSSLPCGKATPAKLQRLEQWVLQHAGDDQSLKSALKHEEELPGQYRAALRVVGQAGATSIVFDGMSAKTQCRRQLARVVRTTLMYLICLVFVSAVLLSFFNDFIVPSLDSMRDDMRLIPIVEAPTHFDSTAVVPILVRIMEFSAFVLLLVMVFGGSSFVTSVFGGRRYQTDQLACNAVRTTRALVCSGTPIQEAFSIGCDLVGGDVRVRRRVAATLRGFTEANSGESRNADQSIEHAESTGVLLGHLDAVADQLQSSASNRLSILKSVLPVTMVAVLGGTVAMTYSLAVFSPVVWMLKDLSMPPQVIR